MILPLVPTRLLALDEAYDKTSLASTQRSCKF
jgi:hypothetical protein